MYKILRRKLGFIKRYISLIHSKFVRVVTGSMVTGFIIDNGIDTFTVDVKDITVGKILRKKGVYGVEEQNLLNQLINNNSTIVFAGTHIGALAIPIAKNAKNAIFIEANPNTFKFLKQNILLNDLKNVSVYNFALGEASGEISFVLNKVNSGGSKREPVTKENMYYYDNPETIKVPMIDLDSLLKTSDVQETIDLIFMDIEGSEFFALNGMKDALKNTKHLVLEFIPHHLRNVANVSVVSFLKVILEYFDHCYIPSKDQYVEKADFINFFEEMYKKNESDDGVIFMKEKVHFKH